MLTTVTVVPLTMLMRNWLENNRRITTLPHSLPRLSRYYPEHPLLRLGRGGFRTQEQTRVPNRYGAAVTTCWVGQSAASNLSGSADSAPVGRQPPADRVALLFNAGDALGIGCPVSSSEGIAKPYPA